MDLRAVQCIDRAVSTQQFFMLHFLGGLGLRIQKKIDGWIRNIFIFSTIISPHFTITTTRAMDLTPATESVYLMNDMAEADMELWMAIDTLSVKEEQLMPMAIQRPLPSWVVTSTPHDKFLSALYVQQRLDLPAAAGSTFEQHVPDELRFNVSAIAHRVVMVMDNHRELISPRLPISSSVLTYGKHYESLCMSLAFINVRDYAASVCVVYMEHKFMALFDTHPLIFWQALYLEIKWFVRLHTESTNSKEMQLPNLMNQSILSITHLLTCFSVHPNAIMVQKDVIATRLRLVYKMLTL